MAVGLHTGKEAMWEEEERIKAAYKAAGRRGKIHEALKDLHRNFRQTPPDVPREYCFLYGKYSEQYLHDMKICQEFADENRKMIAKLILEHYGMEPLGSFTTAHNYIDCDSNVIRKGAVSAKKGERILIPLNMRDGSFICVGKGNPDWNESAPHGAGRRCSRSEAKRLFSVEEYDGAMREAGVYSTSVNHSTLDECPMAYKDKEDILPYIKRVVAEESILRFADKILIVDIIQFGRFHFNNGFRKINGKCNPVAVCHFSQCLFSFCAFSGEI